MTPALRKELTEVQKRFNYLAEDIKFFNLNYDLPPDLDAKHVPDGDLDHVFSQRMDLLTKCMFEIKQLKVTSIDYFICVGTFHILMSKGIVVGSDPGLEIDKHFVIQMYQSTSRYFVKKEFNEHDLPGFRLEPVDQSTAQGVCTGIRNLLERIVKQEPV